METGGEGEMLSPASGRLEPPGAGRGGQGPLLDASRAGAWTCGHLGLGSWPWEWREADLPLLSATRLRRFDSGLGNERNPERPGLRPEGLLM